MNFILDDLDIIKRLIQQGANINAADDDGWTALHYSSFGNLKYCSFKVGQTKLNGLNWNSGQIDVVKYLVQNGANINAKTSYGKTARDLALRWGN